jgi:hypothetical protein
MREAEFFKKCTKPKKHLKSQILGIDTLIKKLKL